MNKRQEFTIAILLFFVVLVGAVSLNVLLERQKKDAVPVSDSGSRNVQVAGETITVTVVRTPEDRAKGLGGRTGLLSGEGMLFVFDTDAKHRFWMKGMLFSIDILWISSDGKIVDTLSRVSPATYPAVFTSRAPARYVLELPAGFIEEYHVRIGDEIGM